MFRKSLCILLTLALLLAGSAISAAAGAPARDFIYEVVTKDGWEPYVAINKYTGQETDLTLPAEIEGVPVRVVALYNFSDCFLERLVIPETVRIVHSGFGRWNAPDTFRELVLSEGLKVIGVEAFRYATSLESVTVPYTVSQIMWNAFPDDLTLRVEKGSYAHRWAVANEHPFEVIVHECSVGDVDADGLCTTTDARLALQQASGRDIFTPEQIAAAADVDGETGLTTTDARLILQEASGKWAVPSISLPKTFESPLFDPDGVVTALERVYDKYPKLIEERDPVDNPRAIVNEINRRAAQCCGSNHDQVMGPSDRHVKVTMKDCTFTFNGWGEISAYYGYVIALHY